MRILINALSGIGDAVMFSPALSVLKKHLPNSQIDMLAMFSQVRDIYRSNRNLNRIFFIDFLHQSKVKSIRELLAIRKNKYDVSINVYPSNRKEYNLLNRFIGAKRRPATKYDHFSFSNYDFLNNALTHEIKDRHNVLENFELIKLIIKDAVEQELCGYDINVGIDDEVHATEYLIDNLLVDKFLVGFHAGSATFKRHINKRWDKDKFIELAKKLHERYMAQILLFGTEKDVNEYIYKPIESFTYIPEVNNIMHTIALMEKCKLFISNDAALMHIASGLHIPTVAIFAYTNYKELHPWKSEHVVVRKDLECSPCFFNSPKSVNCIYTGEDEFKCIKKLEAEEVLEGAEKLIQKIPGDIKPGHYVK
ncbi:MAG: glycosyltransferase family 9 protein [Ignavibacteria bacterium]|jgi:heptosyltransferase-2